MESPLPTDEGAAPESKSAEKSPVNSEEAVSLVNDYYAQWRQDRRPYEVQWFLNAAFVRGQQNVKWNPVLSQLENRKVPSHRTRDSINRILPKVRARLAKFVKNRPLPQVLPANSDRTSVMDAKATEKVLDYQWRRLNLEAKYEDVIMWSMVTGKAFWWFRWDTNAVGRVQDLPPEQGGSGEVLELPLGDVAVELGTAFEVLVADPGISRIGDQPMIMRIKTRPVAEVKKRYGQVARDLTGDSTVADLFQFQKQIAQLGAKNISGFNGSDRTDTGDEKAMNYVVVKELFIRPGAQYPKGRYVVVANTTLLKDEKELPYDFGAQAANPYPVVEFSDTLVPGQFWPTTMVEQLIPVQRQYNAVRQRIDEKGKLNSQPKLLYAKQANLAPNAYGPEAGEKIEYFFIPGMPPPAFLQPPSISSDEWRTLDALKMEFDDLTHIYPSSVGGPGDNGESGFQTNLLQEASDSVHAPDIRRNELSVEEAAFKIRRFMALGYDIPRLVSIVGKNSQPEVFEFSQDNIDEHAHVIVQAGSALPTLKAARAKMIMEMHGAALFGDPNDPATKRKVLGMLEVGGIENAVDIIKRDEDQAHLENLDVSKLQPIAPPMPWENHQIHYEVHTDLLKSPEIKAWSQDQRDELVRHVIMHARFINPTNAMMLAQQFGYIDLVQMIAPMVQPPAAPDEPPGSPEQGPPPPGAQPGPPPGVPPGPPQQ